MAPGPIERIMKMEQREKLEQQVELANLERQKLCAAIEASQASGCYNNEELLEQLYQNGVELQQLEADLYYEENGEQW